MFYEFTNRINNPHTGEAIDVSANEVLENKEKLVLIDVREVSEFNGDLGHVPGSQLIVLTTIPQHVNQLPKDKTIVFICRSGGRSTQACLYALQSGYKNVYNLHGGMMMWNQLMLPIER